MNLEEKLKSIRFRLFAILLISTMLIIFVIVIVNNLVLKTFYTYSKAKEAKKINDELNRYYNSVIQYNINSELRQLETKNDMEILIRDNYDEIVYCENKAIIGYVSRISIDKNAKTIYSDKNTIIKQSDERNDKFMMLISNLDNGYKLYIRIPIIPIEESVKISSEALIIIGIFMAVVSGIVASIISKKVTQRIVKLNDITKKMSKLDFSEKFEENGINDDEIDTLGRNINIMSEKLESTIGQLRKNNNQLEKDIEEKSKIDDMRKQFISDVSHELKTPIALIQGYAEGLAENVNTDDESRKFYAEVIIDESNKMDKMVKELLELMKLEQGELQIKDEEFDLNEIIKEEIKRETKVIKENNIEIDYEKNKKIKVYANPELIEKIVNNYLTNAIKHCKMKDKEKKIEIRTEKTRENKLRLFVYNTGDKIDEDAQEKIWNRFYKVDSSRNRDDGGTGIGLAIVKAIMNKYNNEFGINNYKNGVEFYCDMNIK